MILEKVLEEREREQWRKKWQETMDVLSQPTPPWPDLSKKRMTAILLPPPTYADDDTQKQIALLGDAAVIYHLMRTPHNPEDIHDNSH